MLLRARDNNIQSFAYIWLHKGNQNEFLKHPKIKWLDGELEPPTLNTILYVQTATFGTSAQYSNWHVFMHYDTVCPAADNNFSLRYNLSCC